MKIKKIISVLTAVVIAVCGCGVTAFAASKKPVYMLIGDSIAYGQGIINSSEACYGRIVANTNGYSYINDSISGITSAILYGMLEEELISDDVKKADIIQISIGGNDFLTQNWVWMGLKGMITDDYSDFDPIVETLAANFAKIIDKIRSYNSKATIIVQTVYNPHNDMFEDAFAHGVEKLNSVFYNYLKEHKGAYLIADVGSVISGHSEYVAIDTIHPNGDGNKAIAEYMLKFLKDNGLGTKTEPVITTEPIDLTGSGFKYWLECLMYGLRFTTHIVEII